MNSRASIIGQGLLVIATLCLYVWTVETSSPGVPRIQGRQTDYYNLLARGFLKGQLALDTPVSPALAQADDPYDPARRPPGSALHDASYYRGRYYLYFGAAPAVTLLIPFILVTGDDLPLPYGVGLFVCAGYLALAASFLHLRRKHYPQASVATAFAGLVALSGATGVLILLRRNSMYEFAIAGGFAFCAIALFCMIRSLDSRRQAVWATGAGLALGLAVASRPTYIAAAGMLAVPLIWRQRRAGGVRALLASGAAFGAVVAAILGYNFARFGDPLEFGVNYELSGIIERSARHFSPAFFGFNARVYLIWPLHWGRYFPFVHWLPPLTHPVGYGSADLAFGLFTNLPFSLFSLAVPAVLILGRGGRPDRVCAIAVVAAVHYPVAALCCCFYWAHARYMVDFAPSLALLASLGLLEVESRMAVGRKLTWLRGLGAAAAVFSAWVAVLFSFQIYGQFREYAPRAYNAIGRLFDYPVALMEGSRTGLFGPLEFKVSLPPGRPTPRETLVSTGWGSEVDFVSLESPDGRWLCFGFGHGGSQPTIFSPPLLARAGAQTVGVEMGSLYPPEAHPFFKQMTGGQVHHLKGWLRVRLDGRPAWEIPAEFFDATPGTISVGRQLEVRMESRGPIETVSDRSRPYGPARIRTTVLEGMIGRSFPLVTTGRTGFGNALSLRVLPRGMARLGYDYWGKPTEESPDFSLAVGAEHILEFCLPSMMAPGARAPLTVEVDGALVWRKEVRSHPAGLFQVYIGRNVIGASTCEPVFPAAAVDAIP